jgi:hypothetical protein
MKTFLLSFLLCLLPVSAVAADKQPPNPADYTMTVHVIASHTRDTYSSGLPFPYHRLIAVIDGKSVELTGGSIGVLALGDYKAKVVPTPHAPKDAPSYQVFLTYEFLFPDGKTERYSVTGFEPSSAPSPQP